MDRSAIQEINDNNAAIKLSSKINETDYSAVALPENYKLHSLESYQQQKNSFRGKFETSHLDSFTQYHGAHGENQHVYVDDQKMGAVVIFDEGNTENPGHCNHQGRLQMQKTAAFKAFESLFNVRQNDQRSLAEFIEDWRDFITAIDSDDSAIDIKELILTIRNITIEQHREFEKSESNFSTNKTSMEKIEANSKQGALPKILTFTTEPYKDLLVQEFKFRISIRSGNGEISFGAFRIQEELDTETTSMNFADLLSEKLPEGTTIYLGSFSPA